MKCQVDNREYSIRYQKYTNMYLHMYSAVCMYVCPLVYICEWICSQGRQGRRETVGGAFTSHAFTLHTSCCHRRRKNIFSHRIVCLKLPQSNGVRRRRCHTKSVSVQRPITASTRCVCHWRRIIEILYSNTVDLMF